VRSIGGPIGGFAGPIAPPTLSLIHPLASDVRSPEGKTSRDIEEEDIRHKSNSAEGEPVSPWPPVNPSQQTTSSAYASQAQAPNEKSPAWKQPTPGTQAFLGDDGGDDYATRTVCDTADNYRAWLLYEKPPGCQKLQHDLPVIIGGVILNRALDKIAGEWFEPLANVQIPSRNFTGYARLSGLHPVIPSGVMIHYKKRGNETILLYPAPHGSRNDAIDLGDSVSAKVISYDPRSDENLELRVQIVDGPQTGKTGWMLALGALADNGNPVEMFDGAVVEAKAADDQAAAKDQPKPRQIISTADELNCAEFHQFVPLSSLYERGDYDAAFKDVEPLANARCQEAEHLLGVMYALGQGVQRDLVEAYAWLLLAASDGLHPFGRPVALIPVVADDPHEFEIVQFGAQLTWDQISEAEALATRLARQRGKFADSETGGPKQVAVWIEKIRPLVNDYKLAQ
jgi:hypothetical protein